MTDPTTLTVEEGEPIKIIDEDDVARGIPYIVEVYRNSVRFAHNKRAAKRGATLAAGIPHTLSNFRGQGVWVAAFDGDAEVRVRPAGADFDSQPVREVNIESGTVEVDSLIDIEDRASREIGKARVQNSAGTLVDPATEDSMTSRQPREVAEWSAGSIPNPEYTGVESFSYTLNGGGNEPLPSNTVPPGVSIVVQADPENAEGILVGDPQNPVISLAPSGTITYDVTNTDQIGVNGAENDSVNVTFEVN